MQATLKKEEQTGYSIEGFRKIQDGYIIAWAYSKLGHLGTKQNEGLNCGVLEVEVSLSQTRRKVHRPHIDSFSCHVASKRNDYSEGLTDDVKIK